ncbi:hypothetical protein MMC31_000994 [Peltigera leucophlebia]|nr:hypothetical protein [Peltigera leucophlebia]
MASANPADVNPAYLENYPALAPPAGIIPNFVDPYTRGPIIIIVGSILIALMMSFVVVRIYIKTCINRKVHWDDLTCVLATLGAIVYFVASVYVVKGKVGTHQWNVRLPDILSHRFLLPGYLTTVLVPPFMLFAKITFFLLYLQLFRPIIALRFCIYAGMIFTVGFYASATVVQFYFDTPRRGETFLSHQLGPLGKKALKLSVPLAAVGVIIDFYILVVPIVAVLQLQMAKKRKIGLCLVFGTGSIACISSVLSLYYRILLDRSNDYTWSTFPVILLALVEMCVGVICSCMPAFSSMFRHHLHSFEKIKSSLSSHYRSFRHKFSSRSGPESAPSRSESADGYLMPYSSLEGSEKSKKQSKSLPALHSRLGQLDTLRTYIRGGQKSETPEEGIHVTQDIEQGWQHKSTVTEEKA